LIFKRFIDAEFRRKNIPSSMAIPASIAGSGRGQAAAFGHPARHFQFRQRTYTEKALRQRAGHRRAPPWPWQVTSNSGAGRSSDAGVAIAATHQVPYFYVPYEKIKKNATSNSLFQRQFWLELPS
jgi:hypothetical protein